MTNAPTPSADTAARLLVWGTGAGATAFLEELDRVHCGCTDSPALLEILAFVDNNPERQGTVFSGYEVIGPDRLPEFPCDKLVITSSFADEIIRQLQRQGERTDHILAYVTDRFTCLASLGLTPSLRDPSYTVADDGCLACGENELPVHGKVLRDVAPPTPLAEQEALVSRLLDSFLAGMNDAEKAPPLYRVGENWGMRLKATRRAFYEAVARKDIPALTALLANYCRNCVSSSIMGGREEYEAFARIETHRWLEHNFRVWRYSVTGDGGCPPSIHEAAMEPIGNPYGFDVDGALINWNSFPNHYRADLCGRLLAGTYRPMVAEIGGGFGGFACQWLKQGDAAGQERVYVNFDLPENLIVSSYTLSLAFPEKRVYLYDGNPETVIDGHLLNRYEIVLLPNFLLPNLADRSVEMFLNTISFSEMEYATVVEYLAQISRTARRYLYHENLAHAPAGYKGFPSCVFPAPEGFKLLTRSVARWMGLDAHTLGHSYLEHLFERCNQAPGAQGDHCRG